MVCRVQQVLPSLTFLLFLEGRGIRGELIMNTSAYDIIIIGTGAGGSTIAHALAPTGKKILILERGEFLVRSKDNWDPEKVFRQEIYHTNERWLTKDGAEFR